MQITLLSDGKITEFFVWETISVNFSKTSRCHGCANFGSAILSPGLPSLFPRLPFSFSRVKTGTEFAIWNAVEN